MLIEKRMKVPNGKLLILKATVNGNKFEKVAIQGDFFFHPEEKLQLFEEAVAKTNVDLLHQKLQKIVEENNIKLVGVTIEAVVELAHLIHSEIGK
ncbi:MAG: hypothetical protein AABX51_07805 [Nanoarchaeota archaeon]